MRMLFLITLLFFSFNSFAIEKIKFKTLADLETCERTYSYDTGVCFEPFKDFIQKNPKMTLEAARKGRRVFASWVVLPFFDKALTSSKDLSICTDPEFLISLFNATGQSPDGAEFKLAKKLIQGQCSTKIIDRLLKEIEGDAPTSYLAEMGCPVLKKAGKTTKNCEPQAKPAETKVAIEKLPTIEKGKLRISSAKVYSGPEGSRVVIGALEGYSDLYLIYFNGFKGPWNKKSILHKSSVSGNAGEVDYWTENKSEQWNSVVTTSCTSGYCHLQAHLPESGFKDGIGIYFNESETKNFNTQELIKNF